MTWLPPKAFEQRLVLIVEDHSAAISRILKDIQQSGEDMLHLITAAWIGAAGSDSTEQARAWLAAYPEVQFAVYPPPRLSAVEGAVRCLQITEEVIQNPINLGDTLSDLLRPGGFLLQDIHLETLSFIPQDQWQESFRYVASYIKNRIGRGPLNEQSEPIKCWFMSRQGLSITMGSLLSKEGFSHKCVLAKDAKSNQIEGLHSALKVYLVDCKPFILRCKKGGGSTRWDYRTHISSEDRSYVEKSLDLVFWDATGPTQISGRLLEKRTRLQAGRLPSEAWRLILEAHFKDRVGVRSKQLVELDTGKEAWQIAAAMREALKPINVPVTSILTNEEGFYSLSDAFLVGWVTRDTFF